MSLWLGTSSDLVLVGRFVDDTPLGHPLSRRFTGTLSGAMVVWHRLQVGVDVPVVLSQSGEGIVFAANLNLGFSWGGYAF